MQKVIFSLILVVFSSSYGFSYYYEGESENKDSVLTALITILKERQPEVLGMDKKDEIKFQTFSYLGYIINDDSIPTNRLVSVQTFYKNDSIDKKIIIYTTDVYLGYYKVQDATPRKILNYRYLTFDKMTTDFNDRPVPVKVNLSEGIPDRFEVKGEEIEFIRFLPDHLKERN